LLALQQRELNAAKDCSQFKMFEAGKKDIRLQPRLLPQEIPVHRQEVYDAIKRENEKASRLGPSETKDIG